MSKRVLRKKDILFQSTIVKFRNGMLGIAISDKVSSDDNDGDEVFLVYDKESKCFVNSIRLSCYDDELKNTLSLNGVFKKIDAAKNDKAFSKVQLADSDWDVTNATVYAYAYDAFKDLTNKENLHWMYEN